MAARGRRSFEQMRHLQALAATLSGLRTIEAVGAAVLDELSLALPHDVSALYVIDDAAPVLRAQRGPVAPAADALRGYAERAAAGRRAFLVDDASADHPALSDVPLYGIVAAPLVAEDRALGAIVVGAGLRSRYDRDDQRLLEVIATVAGLAYASLRLLDAIPDGV
jgi:GAF domain-containing protein